ncbi:MAG: PilZ domain-containing protein [Bdellovibrionaceae bacterium]|nr:PilZ domain-containing protein [Pseudobdellovibrionaceae bacterium]
MPTRVVLVDTSYEHQQRLEDVNEAHTSGQYTFETTASFAHDAAFWAAVDVLVLHVPDEPMIQGAFLEKLKAQVGPKTRVIIMAPQMNPALIAVSHQFPKVRLMKLPVTGYALYRALVDITTDYPRGQQQVHPRFLTDLAVEVVSDLKSVKSPARVKNLSISGAYFETVETTEAQAVFVVGDLVRMAIALPTGAAGGVPKAYQFDARIVWQRPLEDGQGIGYGCAFLNKEQVYDELLAQVGR